MSFLKKMNIRCFFIVAIISMSANAEIDFDQNITVSFSKYNGKVSLNDNGSAGNNISGGPIDYERDSYLACIEKIRANNILSSGIQISALYEKLGLSANTKKPIHLGFNLVTRQNFSHYEETSRWGSFKNHTPYLVIVLSRGDENPFSINHYFQSSDSSAIHSRPGLLSHYRFATASLQLHPDTGDCDYNGIVSIIKNG